MKEKNKPEEEKPIVIVKEKRPRPYVHLEDNEIQDLISIYRKLLRVEVANEKETIVSKIETLEKELRFRNKLVKIKSEA